MVTKAAFAFATVIVIGLLGFPRLLPATLGWLRPDIRFRFTDNERTLYLTIDDGPSTATPEILRVLAKNDVRATFFIIGDHVHTETQIVAIRAAGCGLGHHMKSTERCGAIPLDRFKVEFDDVYRILSSVSKPQYFRPPSDLGTTEQMKYVANQGCQPILGTVFPLDHWIRTPWLLRILVRWMAVPGGIIIMHDTPTRGAVTASVLDAVLPELKSAGYQIRMLPVIPPHPAPEPTRIVAGFD